MTHAQVEPKSNSNLQVFRPYLSLFLAQFDLGAFCKYAPAKSEEMEASGVTVYRFQV